MPKILEKILLITTDFLTVTVSFFLWGWLRRELGFFAASGILDNALLAVSIFLFWFLTFLFFGLYRSWYAQSRFDEFVNIFKTVSFGVFLIFLLTLDLEADLNAPPSASRFMILAYWLIMIVVVGTGRMALRTFQRKLLEAGIGLRRTLIVGWSEKARELLDKVLQYPALGYEVIGFVDPDIKSSGESYRDRPVLGYLRELPQIIEKEKAVEILIVLEGSSRGKVVEAISSCNGLPVNLNIVPDLYDIVMGQARTNQIYGFPLIEIMPQLMPPWEKKIKRLIDILVSLFFLLAFLPIWILVALAIKTDSRGPVFYKQKRVGKDGKIFTIYKFRSMVLGAEKMTGPVWADKDDPRITRVGRIIRKLRIDEVPQLINVLDGDMSLIGPRPERPYFVDRLKRDIPLYIRRLKVQPGITGWAQVKGAYDTSLEDVKKKLQYDLFYLENMSLRMDLKIILNTLYVMIAGKGH